MYLNKLYVYAVDFSCFVFILIVRHDVMMERSRKVFTLYRLQKYKKTNETENVSLHKVWRLHEKK